jgi:hypothetical protein
MIGCSNPYRLSVVPLVPGPDEIRALSPDKIPGLSGLCSSQALKEPVRPVTPSLQAASHPVRSYRLPGFASSRSSRDLEALATAQHGPSDASRFCCLRDNRAVSTAARFEAREPPTLRAGPATGEAQDRASAMDQQIVKIAVGALADIDQPDLAAARTQPRHEPDPSRELAAVLELPAIADARHQRRRDHRTDAWYTADAPAEFALPAQREELVIELMQPCLQSCQLVSERRQQTTRQAGQLVGVIGDRVLKAWANPASPLSHDDAAFAHDTTDLSDQGRAPPHQPLARPTQRPGRPVARPVFTGTKRMFDELDASQIASASSSSFLLPLT